MTGPAPKKKPVVDEDEALETEAYGAKGAAMRKTAAQVGKSAAGAGGAPAAAKAATSTPVVREPKGPIDRVENWIGRVKDKLTGKKPGK